MSNDTGSSQQKTDLARLDNASMEDFRAVAAEAVALRQGVEMLLAKYAGRSSWVGFEGPRREAWGEIERDLRDLTQRVYRPG